MASTGASKAPGPGTTRLDRLLTLLDTGSTSATRKTAARQIGELAGQHKSEVRPLLHRVQAYLRSKKWDTRVAAAQAIGAIAENIQCQTVDSLIAAATKEAHTVGQHFSPEKVAHTGAPSEHAPPGALAFASFNIQRVLENGAPLVGSGGQEYDTAADNSSPAERLARQRQNLHRRLGLDGAEQFMDIGDMIRDEDLMQREPAGLDKGSKQGVEELVAKMAGGQTQGLSARERNRLKRKAKEELRASSAAGPPMEDVEPGAKRQRSTKMVVTEQPEGDQSKVVLESAYAAGEEEEEVGGWPFEAFCTQLLHDIFDPVWEIRHGAMMALRELLAAQAASAGIPARSSLPPGSGTPAALTEAAAASTRVKEEADIKLEAVKSEPEWPQISPGTSVKVELKQEVPVKAEMPVKAEVMPKAEVKPEVKLEENSFGEGEKATAEAGQEVSLLEWAQAALAANSAFLEDCSLRLICVFALDRFGDYVSDQVVAPVRETCAQALGSLVRSMTDSAVQAVVSQLLQLQKRSEWEVRHGGLLGLKYVIAVKAGLVEDLLPRILPAALAGLEDSDDDVRAVAADALLPAAGAVTKLLNKRTPLLKREEGTLPSLQSLLSSLWDALLELDDLSPSTGSVMNLLAELYHQPLKQTPKPGLDLNMEPEEESTAAVNGDGMKDEWQDELEDELPPLLELAPRLWPFMRHNVSGVRLAAVRTLERLLSGSEGGSNAWAVPLLGDALRLTFQNLLLEQKEDILESSRQVWRLLLQCQVAAVERACSPFLQGWFKLATTQAGSPLASSLLFLPAHQPASRKHAKQARAPSGKGLREASQVPNRGAAKIVIGSEGEGSVAQMRVQTAWALGVLGSVWLEENLEAFCSHVASLLASQSATQRQVAGMVVSDWFREIGRRGGGGADTAAATPLAPPVAALHTRMLELLQAGDAGMPTPGSGAPYSELVHLYAKMRDEAGALLRHAQAAGVPAGPGLPQLAQLTPDGAVALATSLPDLPAPAAGNDAKRSNSPAEQMASARQRLLSTVGYLKTVQGNIHLAAQAALAGAVVWSGHLPAKLNPLVQPLMAAVRRECEEAFQRPATLALAHLTSLRRTRKPNPSDKIHKNLAAMLCADPTETVIATPENADMDFDMEARAPDAAGKEGAVARRGAESAVHALSKRFGPDLFVAAPKLWECATEGLPKASGGLEQHPLPELEGLAPQAVINSLQVVRVLVKGMDEGLREQELLPGLLPAVFAALRHPRHAAVRLQAGRCLGSLAQAAPVTVLGAVLWRVVPMLEEAQCVVARRGAAEAIAALVGGLEPGTLLPYCSRLLIPLLGRMSDPDALVRKRSTQSFAALVPLLPLAKGVAPLELPPAVAAVKSDDAKFLEQLLDNKAAEDYRVSVPLAGTLRRYQQEGINWLAFLRRFKLHGVLCDDMGLGKTLQATAIMASDTVDRARAYAAHPSPAHEPLPNLVVCPPTLVGHWAFEVEKFVGPQVLAAVQLAGAQQERTQIGVRVAGLVQEAATRQGGIVVIISYDSLRKDIDWLEQVAWNYCVLDEGHVIKNGKSKLAQAAKRLRAEHRLILSGTPIQNNVLELWSLFDFLMPGFLGTDRDFQQRYGRPMEKARDPKCSAKDQEASALAMEALHKQVMPFLLRRTKEEVLADLPPKIIQDRMVELSPLQLALYEKFAGSQARQELSSMVSAYGGAGVPEEEERAPKQASTHVFQALQYLRKLCSHPAMVLDPQLPDHAGVLKMHGGGGAGGVNIHALQHAPKLLALREILLECGIGGAESGAGGDVGDAGGQHRVLIFAQLKGFLDIIEQDLFQAHMPGVSYLRLDGGVEASKRFDVVRRFNSDPTIDVLLLTTHVGGLGLNLTAADTVVFMEHDWNPMRDLQAMDRAHRLGQQRVVNVYRLVTKGTLEEKIMGLQRFKLSIAASVVNADNASLKTMDTGQLLDLFAVDGAQKKKVVGAEVDDAAAAAVATGGPPGKGKGLKAVLNGLEELWDESQYKEEYNLEQFLSKLGR